MNANPAAPTPLGIARAARRAAPSPGTAPAPAAPAQAALVMRVAFDRVVLWTLRVDDGTGEHVVLSGQTDELPYVPDAPPATAFRQAAIEVLPQVAPVLRAAAAARSGFVELAVPNSSLRELADAVAADLGPAQVLASSAIVRLPVVDRAVADADALYATLLAGRIEQTESQLAPKAATLEVATDGSARRHRAPAAAAWVRADGMFATEVVDTADIAVAELAAIRMAIVAHSRHTGELVIKSDSREAISMARVALAGNVNAQSASARRQQRRITECPNRANVRLTWVKGHRGDLLNETANELAIMARRHHEAAVSRTEHRVRARNAVDQMLSLAPGAGAA